MKKPKMFVTATVLTLAAVCLVGPVSAADAKAQPKKAAPAAKAQPKKAAPTAKPAAKPKTMNEIFAFLPNVLATVGNKKITKQDFLNQLGNVPVEYIAQFKPEMLKMQSKQMINTLVEFEIMLALAEKAGVKVTKETILAEFDKKLKSMPKEQQDMIEKQLKLQGKTIADVKKQLVSDPNTLRFATIQKYVEQKVMPQIKVSNAEIEKYYREHQNQFMAPETVNASHILISTMPDQNAGKKPTPAEQAKKDKEAKAKAEKILAQLKQGADFAAIAAKESDCPSKQQKGNLGNIQRGQMVPEFEKAAFALTKPGQLSGIVKTQFGYHIIKLNKKTPAAAVPLAKVKDGIRAQLQNDGIRKALEAMVAKAKQDLKVTVVEIK